MSRLPGDSYRDVDLGENPYLYCNHDPINYTDSDGMEPENLVERWVYIPRVAQLKQRDGVISDTKPGGNQGGSVTIIINDNHGNINITIHPGGGVQVGGTPPRKKPPANPPKKGVGLRESLKNKAPRDWQESP